MVNRSGRDALAVLAREHDEMRTMIERLDELDGAAAMALLLRLRDEVWIHGRIEDEILYPAFSALLDDEDAEGLVEDSREDHAFIDQLLDEVVRVPVDSVSFGDDIILLRESIQRHADEEEDELFPRLQRACSEAMLEELGQRMMQRKQSLRRQRRRRRAADVARDAEQEHETARRRLDSAHYGLSKTDLMRMLRSK